MSEHSIVSILLRIFITPIVNHFYKPVQAYISNYIKPFTAKKLKKILKVSDIDGNYDLCFISAKTLQNNSNKLPPYVITESSRNGVYFVIREFENDLELLTKIIILYDKLEQDFGHDTIEYKTNVIKAIYAGYDMLRRKKNGTADAENNNLPYAEVNNFSNDLLSKLNSEGKLDFILK